jgi:putative spermidine/putrescine transport system permease protein
MARPPHRQSLGEHSLAVADAPAGLPAASAILGRNSVSAGRSRRLALLIGLPTIVVIVLLVLPLLLLLRFSFLVNIPGKGLSDQTTLANYEVFGTDPFYRGSIWVTILTALLVTAICLILSFPVAYAYARTRFGPKGLLLIAILSPFYIDILVRIYAWMVVLGRNGVVDNVLLALGILKTPVDFRSGYFGIVIILVYVTLPFMILSLIGPLQNIDDSVVEAAQVCGAEPGRVVSTVILPLSIPGIVAGTILSFSVGISAFVVPLLVGGKIGQQFLAVVVYGSMNIYQDWALGAAASAILLVVSLGIVLAYNRIVRSLRVGTVMGEQLAA